MTIDEHIKYWISTAKNDLTVAKQLFASKNYSWCLFIGHLVIEKTLKAHFVKNNNNSIPPKIHDLIKLAKLSDIKLNMEKEEFYFLLNKFNIEARYPDYKHEISVIATEEFTSNLFDKIIKEYEWLKSRIIL